jgi:hypothetical protein
VWTERKEERRYSSKDEQISQVGRKTIYCKQKWLRKVRVNKTTSGVMFGAALGAYPALRKFPETYTRHYPRYTTEVNNFTSTVNMIVSFRPDYTNQEYIRMLARGFEYVWGKSPP